MHALFKFFSWNFFSIGIDWVEYKRQLKKAEQWNVEVY